MMATTNHDESSAAVAALELLGIKHHRPSRTECRATSDLLRIILKSTGDALQLQPSSPAADRFPHRALPATLSQTVESAVTPPLIKRDASSTSNELPMPVADVSRDEDFLSPLQCYVRKHCVEYFAATASNAVTKGRQTPVSEGRVGVRCAFCKHVPRGRQASQATSFPNQIESIYSSVVMVQCRHFPKCHEMPDSVRTRLVTLKQAGNTATNSSSKRRQDYWIESAQRMGFVNTREGVRFVPARTEESSSTSREIKSSEEATNEFDVEPNMNEFQVKPIVSSKPMKALPLPRPNVVSPFEPMPSSPASIDFRRLIKGSALVTLEDRDLVPDHVFLALAQLEVCQLTADDKIGTYRSRAVGFQGMRCRYCHGSAHPGPGFGKFFPNSVRSLAQTTTSQTIVKHIATKCKHVPWNVRDAVSTLLKEFNEDTKPAYASKNSLADDGRPKYGSRREFFQRIWDRLHGDDEQTPTSPPTEASGTPEYNAWTPIADSCQGGFSFTTSEVIRPTPIRHAIPFSCNDVSSSDSENFADDLFDDKDRRVIIRGSFFSRSDSKKRMSTLDMAFTPIKKPRVS